MSRDIGPVSYAILPVSVGREFPVMSALACYFDDSRDSGVEVIAGYVGTVDMWDNVFAPAWKAVLDNAPHPISEFHAVDCRHGRGEFDGWKAEERNDLTKALVSVIVETCQSDQIVGLGQVVVSEGFPSGVKVIGDVKHFFRKLSLAMVITEAFQLLPRISTGPPDDLRLVFDDHPKLEGYITNNFYYARAMLGQLGNPPMASRVSPPEFEDSKKSSPLQAADLLAYETMKEAKTRWLDAPMRKPSGALVRLVEGRFHRATCIDVDLASAEEGTKSGSFLYHSGRPMRDVGLWGIE